jgi:pantothenate kinase
MIPCRAAPLAAAPTDSRQPCAAAAAAAAATRQRKKERRFVAAAAADPRRPAQIVAPVATFEDAGEWLAQRAVSLADARGPGGRAVIGIAGPPGGGKSTLSKLVCARADELLRRRQGGGGGAQVPLAAVLPMDGFHYTRAQLDASPDPIAAHARRGAPWTFDAGAFVAAVAAAAAAAAAAAPSSGSSPSSRRRRPPPPPPPPPPPLRVPSFDHATKDPVPDAIEIPSEARVVLVEGNYLLLDEEPWARLWRRGGGGGGGGDGGGDGDGNAPPPAPPLLDETWFVDAPLEAAMAHIFKRQTSAGVGLSASESRRRVEHNDAPNARLVLATRGRADVLVPGELPMRGETDCC